MVRLDTYQYRIRSEHQKEATEDDKHLLFLIDGRTGTSHSNQEPRD
jgi:hypothetical protein